MNLSRRNFFRSVSGLAVMPVVGLAKVCGAVERQKPPLPFKNYATLTAADLNDRFQYVIHRLDAEL